MSDREDFAPKPGNRGKGGRPRLVLSVQEQEERKRIKAVVSKVQRSNIIEISLVRTWLANELGISVMELENRVYANAVRDYIRKHPHLAAKLVDFRIKKERAEE